MSDKDKAFEEAIKGKTFSGDEGWDASVWFGRGWDAHAKHAEAENAKLLSTPNVSTPCDAADETCEYKHFMSGYSDSTCGREQVPFSRAWTFCPYCGKRIKEKE